MKGCEPMKRKITATLMLTIILCFLAVQAHSAVSWGSRGDEVRRVQERLIRWGYMTGTADGIFGQSTYNGVIRFQKKNGLKADGIAGPATLAALGLPSAATASAADSEVYLLARLVHGEARGEPYVGKVAVAAVVLNRVRSSSFPNTISGVIYQAGAFDCVADGQINLTPDSDSIRAARDAMNGWDPSGGCLYYYNPSTATNNWIWTREVRLAIGNHNFAM